MYCPNCESTDTYVNLLDEVVPYGDPIEVELAVNIPVHFCRTCAFSWTDKVAETCIDEAIKDYLKAKIEGCRNGKLASPES